MTSNHIWFSMCQPSFLLTRTSHLPLGEHTSITATALVAGHGGCPVWEKSGPAPYWSQSVPTHTTTMPRPVRRAPGRDRGGWQHGGQGALEGTREEAQEDTQKEIFMRGGTPLRWLQLCGGATAKQGHPQGTMAVENQGKEGTNKQEGAGEEKKSKKEGAAARSHPALTQPPAPPVTSPKG